MQVTSVSYGKTFNLGDFESERIDMSAELSEGDTPEGVLEELKELVGGSSGVVTATAPSVLTESDTYPIFNYEGALVKVFDTAYEWLKGFETGASLTNDIRKFLTSNMSVFNRVKEEARGKENPRAFQTVIQIENKIGEMCK